MTAPSIEEQKRTSLDAFAGNGIGAAVRVIERPVRRPARRAVNVRIVAFQQDDLVALHAREVVPMLIRIVDDVINATDPTVRVVAFRCHQIRIIDALVSADDERFGFYRADNRTPDID